MQLVDAAMKSFDEGELPISRGTTLNDFLRSFLLCKSTRLRKKIKNANFCTRTYSPKVLITGGVNTNIDTPTATSTNVKFADLYQKFLSSISDDYTTTDNTTGRTTTCYCDQHLLRFSMSRTWGVMFWQFCMDVGYTNLKSDDWWKGLEEIEVKALAAKNRRKQAARRKRVDTIPKTGVTSGAGAGGGTSAGGGVQSWDNTVVSQRMECDFQSPMCCGVSTDNNCSRHELPMLPNPNTAMYGVGSSALTSQHSSVCENQFNNHAPQQQQFKSNSLIQNTTLIDYQNDPQPPQSKRARPMQDVVSKDSGNISAVTDICDKLADWDPFIERVSKFLEEEHLPFQYFDVWIADDATNTCKELNKNGGKENKTHAESVNTVSLRHVGHATNPGMDCIFTLYHMNEFGRYSSNFMFAPGVGLPGRVYNTGTPLWDDSIQDANLNDFPRVNGARSHGVKKALGIPLAGRTEGETIILGLYSSDVIPKDEGLVQKCCMEFQRYQLKVSYELVLDIGNGSYAESETLAIGSGQVAGVIDVAKEDVDNSEDSARIEENIVDLLGRYAPIESNPDSSSNVTNLLHSFMSLRLLLLRTQSHRTDDEISAIKTLKCSYGYHLKSNKRENEIAMLLANDWTMLRSDFSCKLRQVAIHPIAMNINEINHAST